MSVSDSSRPGIARGLSSMAVRAAAVGMRPLGGVVTAVAETGIDLERRVVDRIVESGEVERLLESQRLQELFAQALGSDGAQQLVDAFFDSPLFDHVIDRLLESDALWRLVDRVAGSPAVTAAISQQGLGFADQVAGELRTRSRRADDWVEESARRLLRRSPRAAPQGAEGDVG